VIVSVTGPRVGVGGTAVGGTAVGGTVVGAGVGVAAEPQAESRMATRVKMDRTSRVIRLCFMFSSPCKVEWVYLSGKFCEDETPSLNGRIRLEGG
jgi:hypothetical protein